MIKIAHIADIHFRALSRHDEYKKAFIEFADDAKKNQVDYIFVGGDIFHTKTSGISPEYIELLVWWLNTLAAVAPVHMILGNHDGNLSNSSRQDAVTPIIEALNHKDIHLYKQSGIYEFHPGFMLCVYSIFDLPGWDKVAPTPGKTNIACYHGPVWGAKTETGWDIEGDVDVAFFKQKGYDIVLLGDIHLRQYLDFKDTEIIVDEADLDKYPDAEVIEEIDS
jgi:DNA repair exonuclease SbcCD nuclease subunit